MVRTGATFADAAAEFLRYVEHDRAVKPSTLVDYRSVVDAQLVPAFGERRLETITAPRSRRGAPRWSRGAAASRYARTRLLVLLHGDVPAGDEGLGAAGQPGRGVERHPRA